MNEMPIKHTKYVVGSSESLAGTGNWATCSISMEVIWQAAADWKRQLEGVEKPWLCWNVNDRWCILQQKLIREVGWTPVIGADPRVGPPPLLPGTIWIDFNRHFQLPVMWPHVPLEFAFLFAPRLAFWHSDLLCRLGKLRNLAGIFERLKDGQMAAVFNRGGLRHFFDFRKHRYWELICCTTRGASEDQFRRGAGWWRHFAQHPSCVDDEERARRARYYYDSGVGVLYWKRKYGGSVIDISLKYVNEGHCTSINRKGYRFLSSKQVHPPVGDELEANYDLEEVAKRLGLAHLL